MAGPSVFILEAQQRVFSFRHFTTEDGLPHRNNTAVFIDDDGFCWAASEFAISRMDGNGVSVFDRENAGEGTDHIVSISQDNNRDLWLWNEKDCYLFDPYALRTQRVSEVYDPGRKLPPHWWNKPARFPQRRPDGALVFNPDTLPVILSVERTDPDRANIPGPNQWIVEASSGRDPQLISHLRVDLPGPFLLLALDGRKGYWVRTNDRIAYLNHRGELMESAVHADLVQVRPVCVRDGTLYYTTISDDRSRETPFGFFSLGRNGIATDMSKAWSLPDLRRVYYESGEGVFWIEYLTRWELRAENGNLLTTIPREESTAGFYQAVSHSWDASSTEGGLWIASENGVCRLESANSNFLNWFTIDEAIAGADNLSVRGIWANRDTIVVAAEIDGVWSLEKKTGDIPQQLSTRYGFYLAGRGLTETFTYSLAADYLGLLRDRTGDFWLGHKRSVIRYSPKTETYTAYPPAFEYQLDLGFNPWCFYEAGNLDIWVGMQPGVGRISSGQDSLRLLPVSGMCEALNEATVYRIVGDDRGRVWCGTSKGLFELSATGECLARYWSEGSGNHFLPYDNLLFIEPAAAGKWWLGTRGSGLVLFDPGSGRYRQWDRRSGLSNEVIYSVLSDEIGAVWLASDFGLMRLDTARDLIATWSEEDGLPHHEFNRGGAFRDENGHLYFGTLNGVTEVDPAAFQYYRRSTTPLIRILSYWKWDDGGRRSRNLTAEIVADSVIHYYPDDAYINLELSIPDFDERPSAYYYRLGETDWQKLEGYTIREGRLPYGHYDLEIKAQLPDGDWTDRVLRLRVISHAPIFLQTWFWMAALTLFGLMVWSLLLLRTRKLRNDRLKLRAKIEEATREISRDKALIESQARELKELDEVKNRFFANVSHELRTPLTLILGPLRNLSKASDLSAKQLQFLRLAEQSGKDLLRLVNTILDLGKIEANGMEVTPVPTQLPDFSRQLLAGFENTADLQRVALLFSCRIDHNLYFLIDRAKLGSIINNLMANALRFTPAEGRITLSVWEEGERLHFSVEDTGVGIHPDDLPHLFDRYYQARNGGTSLGGSGIGLSLCRELSLLMGGLIKVRSSVGVGTIFHLELPRTEISVVPQAELPPVSDRDNAIEVVHAPAGENSPNTARLPQAPRILIVEDNGNMRQYLRSILEDRYRVRSCIHGGEAITLLEKDFYPDLIVTDIMMPIMDGFAMIHKIKADPRFLHIPLIVLTAREATDDRLRALRYGVDDYLSKPFSEEELLVRIRRLLENYHSRSSAVEEPEAEASTAAEDNGPAWLHELDAVILKQLDNPNLKVDQLAGELFVSARQLNRKLKKAVGLSANHYIREIRLNEGLRLLETGELSTVKEAAYRVGFGDPEYFSQRFRERFGRQPSSYL